jgi:hypothetical protein
VTASRFETACLIAGALGEDGVYSQELPISPRQDFVDLWWSALSAGRMLGVRVDIQVSEPIAHGEDCAVVSVEVRTRDRATSA